VIIFADLNSPYHLLGCFLFSGDDVEKKVKVLSGGEKARVALAKVIVSKSNFLLLDEPTNHLDIRSKDILKNALLKYEGTLIIVSHDRDFLDGLVNKLYKIARNYTLRWKMNLVKGCLGTACDTQKWTRIKR